MRVLFSLPLILLLAACSHTPPLPEACDLKPESGICPDSLMRFYLDDRTGTCKGFIWGGCGGVAPFDSMESCHAQCMPGKPMPAIPTLKKPAPEGVTP